MKLRNQIGEALVTLGYRLGATRPDAEVATLRQVAQDLRGSLRKATTERNRSLSALLLAGENLKSLKAMARQTANVSRYARMEALQTLEEWLDGRDGDDTVRVAEVKAQLRSAYSLSSAYQEARVLRALPLRVAEALEVDVDDVRQAVAANLPASLTDKLDEAVKDVAEPLLDSHEGLLREVRKDLGADRGNVSPIGGPGHE